MENLQKIILSPEYKKLQEIMSSPAIQQVQKIMSSPEYKLAQEILSSPAYQQTIHLTSKIDTKVAEKIEKVSQEIFEKNREAYRILANK